MNKYPILRSWLFYMVSLVVLYACYHLLFYIDSMSDSKNHILIFLLIGTYIALGVFLNIMITNKLIKESIIEYHEFTNTIDNIAGDKIWMLVSWIISYPLFLIKFTITETL